ncbi:MAG: DNA-directed RNA polymerase subunit beta [Oscillospiraceae bacterium]|jgi:DNA-directed RNA polymerase subunit beta|nr:DNA-directed RNA polymerase subunit beta [Oscillospiraceae bacterium]
MVKDIYYGKTLRKSFARHQELLEMPNLLEIQKNSYRWFLEKGLEEVFRDVGSIADYAGNLELSFINYTMDEEPKYSVEECKARDATYAAPIKVRVRLRNKETEEIKEQEIFMGDFPLMTKAGTFVINGAERVIVSQIVRSPGMYFARTADKAENLTYGTTIIPGRGAWLEYETDLSDVFWVRIDKNRKIPVTCLIRATGPRSDAEILEMFGEDPRIVATLEKDTCKTYEEAMLEIYRKLRPGEPPTVDSAENLMNGLFFDARRYDLSAVGRYKFNKKMAIAPRISGHTLAQPVVDPATGEILADAGETLTREQAWDLQAKGVNEVVLDMEGKPVKVFSNHMVDMKGFVSFAPEECGITESVRYPVLMDLIAQANGDEETLKELVSDHRDDLVPKHIIVDDIMASINYLNGLASGVGVPDDIDHLGNRRLRCVGELLQNQFRIGFSRMERVIRERMTVQDLDIVTPQSLINIRPVTAAIKEFFGSSPLSQFMDQTNPLAELTHKRRVSALGPGGLSRDRASFDVRDIHYSHYGRLCPLETPEGPNIGLISYLASYAKVNRYGFIETPYRKVDKATGKLTDEVEYMTADVEDQYIIAQATEPTDENGCLTNERITCRYRNEIIDVDRERVDYIDVAPKMMVSIATAMIPFLENDDATRAMMGANMQRQAVPLLTTEAPIVATGQEYKNCIDSEIVILAEGDGEVTRVSADFITIRYDDGRVVDYKLTKFMRSNHTTCINQRPIVSVGERVHGNRYDEKGELLEPGTVLVDGPSTDHGELALGKNILMGFMNWEGYNYEDAILLNERMVKDDVFTSIHIEEYEAEARDTKLGPEEITRDIPNVGEDALKDLDERGIIRVGAEVRPGDILVGKVTPKGETDLTAEERLLRAIFGEKAREVRDTSLKVPHGESGIVVNVDVFTRENGDELPPGVNMAVRIYIAQKRKISVGDKMAGRHGNKGVVSRILPQEDMPFLPDGTPLDIVLNPLGVPSRMNIGQVLEVHLGYAAKALGWKVATPIFNGANERDIQELLKEAGLSEDGKSEMYDGRTGEKFDNRVTTGYVYFLKLHHLVDDKIHARSTGPYSLVTQQPLGGKAQFGGQRFGEMEMWALEAYGAAYTLREMLTVKSDDVTGRVKTYEAIVKGHNVPSPGVPEAFKVLVKELQALCLDIQVLDRDGSIIELKEEDEDTYPPDRVREDDEFYQYRDENEFASAGGFSTGEMNAEGDVIADEEDEEDEDFADEFSEDDFADDGEDDE